MKPYEVKFKGKILALAKIGLNNSNYEEEKIITTNAKVKGICYPASSQYGVYTVDESVYDYETEEIEPIYNDEFEIIAFNGAKYEAKNRVIKEIIKIFDEIMEVEV